jgi:hypothetical protein
MVGKIIKIGNNELLEDEQIDISIERHTDKTESQLKELEKYGFYNSGYYYKLTCNANISHKIIIVLVGGCEIKFSVDTDDDNGHYNANQE